MALALAQWRPYPVRSVWHNPAVVGDLLTVPDFYSSQFDNTRDLHVLLPASYHHHPDRRYPVVYMQDGQNLFDHGTAFGGQDWRVDETMRHLADEHVEAIIVALDHTGERRVSEYNPFPSFWNGQGQRYVQFLQETVKPLIDQDFRTRPDRAHTGIMGSSLGGLISLYAFFAARDTFGFAGAMSPAFWVGGGAIYNTVEQAPTLPGKLYLDNGTLEHSAHKMHDLLIKKGYQPDVTVKHVVEVNAGHTESAWARRLPDALRFLLKN